MKKLLLTCLLFAFSLNQSSAQFYSQYFDVPDSLTYNPLRILVDSSSNNIWQIGPPQKVIFNSSSTLPNAIVTDTINTYPVNDSSSFIIKIPVWSPFGIFAVQWMQKLDMDAQHDGGYIEYSTDTGQTWENVFNNPYVYNFYGFDSANADTLMNGDFAFSGTDSVWKNVWLCFDFSWWSTFSNDTVLFRFTFKSDSIDNAKEGWIIDNMFAQTTFIHTVKEGESTEYLNVFPNPSTGIINIQMEKIQEFHIIEKMELIDITGKSVQMWENIPVKFWIDGKKYKPGVYFLKVKTNIRSEFRQIVIE